MVKKIFLTIAVFVIFSVYAHAGFPEQYNAEKDITDFDRTFQLISNSVVVSYTRPAVPMKPFNINFHFNKDNIKSVSYSTNMKMNMGRYVYKPARIGDNTYTVSPTLPKCGSGNTLWYGMLEILYSSGSVENLIFFYNVK